MSSEYVGIFENELRLAGVWLVHHRFAEWDKEGRKVGNCVYVGDKDGGDRRTDVLEAGRRAAEEIRSRGFDPLVHGFSWHLDHHVFTSDLKPLGETIKPKEEDLLPVWAKSQTQSAE